MASTSEKPAQSDPPSAPFAPGASDPAILFTFDVEVMLLCGDGKRLRAGRYQLSAASSVLRGALELLPAGGSEEEGGGADTTASKELRVDEPSGVWETALRMLRLDAHALPLVTWDNMEALLRLGHKYDMPLLGGYCAHFICERFSDTDLAQPLESPRNTLRAVSLLHKYGGPSAAHYTTTLCHRLHTCHLDQLQHGFTLGQQRLSQLEQLLSHPRYAELVADAVQYQVTVAFATSLRRHYGGVGILAVRAGEAPAVDASAASSADEDVTLLGGEVTLLCGDGKRLRGGRYQLAAASPVLSGALELLPAGGGGKEEGGGADSSPPSGELRVDEDGGMWEAALQLLRLDAYTFHVLTWDNVEALLRLSDKYDMGLLRSYCAYFLAAGASSMGLSEPLESPKNLLRAASLLELHVRDGGVSGGGGDAQQHAAAVAAALKAALAQLQKTDGLSHGILYNGQQYTPECSSPLAQVERILAHEKYTELVTPRAQEEVTRALVLGMRRAVGTITNLSARVR